MADTVTIDNGTLTDYIVSTDEVAVAGSQPTGHVAWVKLVDGTPNGTDAIQGSSAFGLEADVTRLPALPAGTNNIGDVDVLTQPVRARTTDAIAVALQSDAIMSALTALTPKFAKANIAASTTDGAVITAVSSKKLRILCVAVMPAATATNVTFNSKPGGAGTAISSLWACPANAGPQRGFSPVGWFETASGEGLTATTGTGSTVGIDVVYIEV